jgi:hypothetical protein
MKSIIMFTGGIETLDYFTRQLADAFIKLGHKVFLYDLLNDEIGYLPLIAFCKENDAVAVGFNYTGISGERFLSAEKASGQAGPVKLFFDEYNIPYYNIVVDHPFYYHSFLKMLPAHYYELCIDRGHLRFLHEYYPEIKNSDFLPLAGTNLLSTNIIKNDDMASYKRFASRKMDIVFAGNYTAPEYFEKFFEEKGSDYEEFYRGIADDLMMNPDTPMETAFTSHIRKELGNIGMENERLAMKNMIFIDLYVRFRYRAMVIKKLTDGGFNVHTFGAGYNKLLPELKHPENLTQHGGVSSEECLRALNNAKISLNVMPWFKEGAHDRVFNSILNGALCLTDPSSFLIEELKDGIDIAYYSLKNVNSTDELCVKADYYLTHSDEAKEVILNGYKKCMQFHTWAARAEKLHTLIEYNKFK